MVRQILLAAVALVLALSTAATTFAQSAPPDVRVTQVDTSQYPTITVYVSARDAAGRPLGGLSQRDFSITEDGKAVPIDGFVGSGGGAVTAALVLDRSGSMEREGKMDGAQEAARAFIAQMRPADSTALIAFNERANLLSSFSGEPAELQRAVGRLRADGGTALYDSLIAGVDVLKQAGGRRALLLLTDGRDCRDSSICPREYGSRSDLDEAIAYASASGQPVYVIGLGERGGDERDGIDEGVLRRIAGETGGEYFYAPRAAELASLYTRLAGDLHEEYALTYTSPRPFNDGTRRDIRVTVGPQSAAAAYTEQHLINVQSSPLVGAALLVPLLALLLLPAIGRRKGWKRLDGAASEPRPDAAAPASASSPLPQPAAATPAPAPRAPAAISVVPGDVPHCVACDQPIRPGARFCSACGASQAGPGEPAAPRPTFCDQCGNALLAGARFCTACGAAVPAAVDQVQER